MSKITDNHKKQAYHINDFSAFLYMGICKSGLIGITLYISILTV